jgi:hypothetical protein
MQVESMALHRLYHRPCNVGGTIPDPAVSTKLGECLLTFTSAPEEAQRWVWSRLPWNQDGPCNGELSEDERTMGTVG